jgi:hypothetical protein
MECALHWMQLTIAGESLNGGYLATIGLDRKYGA